MSDSIFGADNAPVQQQTTPQTTVENKPSFTIPTELQDMVGDGKKYGSVEAALKSVPHAQTHIKTLEDENKQLKEELLKRQAASDLLAEFKAQNTPTQYSQPAGVEVDQEALASIVESVLERKSAQTQAQTNRKLVTSKFEEMYGTKAEETFYSIAKANGLTPVQMNNLAVQSPALVLNLAGMASTSKPTLGRVHSDVQVPSSNQQQPLSSSVGMKRTTKNIMDAYAIARQKVEAQYK